MTILRGEGRLGFILLATILGLVIAALFAIADLRWRADVLVMKLKGDIPDVSLVQLAL